MFFCVGPKACRSLCFPEPVNSAASDEVILNFQESWLEEDPSAVASVDAASHATRYVQAEPQPRSPGVDTAIGVEVAEVGDANDTQDTGLVRVEPQARLEEVPSIAAFVAVATQDARLAPVEPQPLSFGEGSAVGIEVAEVGDANDSSAKDDAPLTARSVHLCKTLRDETSDCIMGSSGAEENLRNPPMLLGRTRSVNDDPEHLQKLQNQAIEARRHKLLRAFLVSSGFTEVNGKKNIVVGSSTESFSYPLHTAVTANNQKAVEVLIWAGADKSLVDSSLMTPLALARNLDTEGSHSRIIELLTA